MINRYAPGAGTGNSSWAGTGAESTGVAGWVKAPDGRYAIRAATSDKSATANCVAVDQQPPSWQQAAMLFARRERIVSAVLEESIVARSRAGSGNRQRALKQGGTKNASNRNQR